MNEQNTFFDNLKNKFNSLSPEIKKGIIIATAIIILILGIFMGCKANVSHSDYNAALAEIETAKQETDKIKQEYKEYKDKMQPYEAQQEADVKAAEEKAAAEKAAKEAEEKAKKEAEEKARQEAEEKAKAEKEAKEAEARAKTLGVTRASFLQQYNINASQYGADTATIPSDMSDTMTYTRVNNSISFDLYGDAGKDGYLSMVYINYTNSGSEYEALQFQISFVAAAQTIDTSMDYQTALALASELATASIDSLGSDVSRVRNGYKYTFNSEIGSTVAAITKAN